mmetsp:Transcript_11072/g.20695  ORF Transcript_11072/g.20695 Transcript_11072/m.20695 type:complete len:324 (+) Transcript_11072:42-1013(+)|eukprot:CAMPEP_0176489478 /NCGR_PEP_ID=MMETSP0200_2-20121128/7310_1 /TAXON_ID=947934 /ORGANISM="Chaetoceros sp., Strain GSL56" /LENGTH=323 /DNA_ID=CAMNT_0017886623 /DNA_START=33 /DNA_END=1004 /DNA_ORIENTATION=-
MKLHILTFLSFSLNAFSQAFVQNPLVPERPFSLSISATATARTSKTTTRTTTTNLLAHSDSSSSSSNHVDWQRRNFLQQTIPFAIIAFSSTTSNAATSVIPTTSASGNLPDLPPEASRSYLQYRIPLQIAADFYIFDLQNKLSDVDSWGDINQLFQTNNNRGQGQPNKIERDFTNPMRILGLSMPPDEADAMRDAQFKFERSMQIISRSVQGVRRDLPVEIDKNLIKSAEQGWEEGRVAINEFFAILNGVTGLDELKPIPASGPDQIEKYGRSPRKYNELVKKTKLCQNRGGPALSQAWGYLQTTQLLQDSCGIPDLDEYFYQ